MNYQMIEYAVRRYIDEKKLFDEFAVDCRNKLCSREY